jgi:hypothetical protein
MTNKQLKHHKEVITYLKKIGITYIQNQELSYNIKVSLTTGSDISMTFLLCNLPGVEFICQLRLMKRSRQDTYEEPDIEIMSVKEIEELYFKHEKSFIERVPLEIMIIIFGYVKNQKMSMINRQFLEYYKHYAKITGCLKFRLPSEYSYLRYFYYNQNLYKSDNDILTRGAKEVSDQIRKIRYLIPEIETILCPVTRNIIFKYCVHFTLCIKTLEIQYIPRCARCVERHRNSLLQKYGLGKPEKKEQQEPFLCAYEWYRCNYHCGCKSCGHLFENRPDIRSDVHNSHKKYCRTCRTENRRLHRDQNILRKERIKEDEENRRYKKSISYSMYYMHDPNCDSDDSDY